MVEIDQPTLSYLLDRGRTPYGVWKPYLVFEYIITTHKFNPTMYTYVDVSHRENLHNTIMKLHNEGWGYTKIHKYLKENGFEIGKSRTTVYSMIKRIKKRKQFLSNENKGRFGSFRVEVKDV